MARSGTRQTLMAALAGLQDALMQLFLQRQQAQGRRRRALQRRLRLGLELFWKIEEQVLLPAVQDAEPGRAPLVAALMHELELMRDLSLLSVQTASNNRDISMSVLEGMATLHFTRVQEVLAAAGTTAAPVDWAALDAEVQGLLGRWRSEALAEGHIEDEEADPVGALPR
jgi:hypothetical protein